ncbi:ABC transporter substrate-binding protein [Labrys wisconsinensis]|uniref:sn-glycerol-3-phosphate-binding periplasmic protein UgpB n=1 Tax=Labrys wisconsinensis TaxID=425677 RepID=A0ABU0J2S5_9HYPH|nr:sugar ABC transporter substrate-binding protein [Labrys wisconsinensis]MDQ0468560.1 multiple sugar transport system substrate-binding protein [Labrys wisconsinensis]
MFNDISRRQLLRAGASLGAAGAMGALACPAVAQGTSLTFATWGNPGEEAAFRHIIEAYKAVEPGVTVNLEIVPGDQQYQRLDTRLAGRQAPDLVRIQYQQIGRYAVASSMLDLGPMLKPGYMDDFADVHRSALTFGGKQFAMPFDNNTLAIYYDKEAMAAIGEVPPTTIDKAWTWADLERIAAAIVDKKAAPYPMAVTWAGAQAYRWLIFLYQHGGALLTEDLTAPAINSKEGIETIAWTASWFKKGWVPANTSIKSSENVENLFANGGVALAFAGQWTLSYIDDLRKKPWGVTFMCRDKQHATDLGADCIAVTRDAKTPQAAADFLQFMAGKENLAYYDVNAGALPTRKSLQEPGALSYSKYTDSYALYVEQSKYQRADLVQTVTLPKFARMNSKLGDELELAFASGQSAEDTAANIANAVQDILG